MTLRGFDAELVVEIPDFDFSRFAGCAGPHPHGDLLGTFLRVAGG